MRKIFSTLLLLAANAAAQRPAPLTPAQAQQREAALKANPGDLTARAALLEYYFRSAPPAQAIAARRAQILWLIQNAPDNSLAGSPAATIDASGHKLADAEGFKVASAAWKAQAALPNAKAQTLANAAYFFKLSDLGYAQTLLERATTLEPSNKELGARLGDLYAMGILGLTMVNGNGYPQAASAALAQGPLGLRSRQALEASRNPYTLAKAGYMLSFQGTILRGSGLLAFDPNPLADRATDRAVSLAPQNAEVAAARTQQRELEKAGSAARR